MSRLPLQQADRDIPDDSNSSEQQNLVMVPYLLQLLLSLFVSITLTADAQTLESLRPEFINPPKGMRPMARWWWPGGDVTSDEVRREVRVLDEAVFGGAEIQALRVGLRSDMPLDVAAR